MRTVKWLRDELAKFPNDALCFAYEGEIHGVIIREQPNGNRPGRELGVIHCGEVAAYDFDTDFTPPPVAR